MKLRPIVLLIPFFFGLAAAQESDKEKELRMQWFAEAKLGIFIHWGIYAVNGIDESWSFYNGYLTHDDYMKQLKGFTAANYNPAAWAQLIKESGARYAVLTSKLMTVWHSGIHG
jgi:alpha-L-fucosidase